MNSFFNEFFYFRMFNRAERRHANRPPLLGLESHRKKTTKIPSRSKTDLVTLPACKTYSNI